MLGWYRAVPLLASSQGLGTVLLWDLTETDVTVDARQRPIEPERLASQ